MQPKTKGNLCAAKINPQVSDNKKSDGCLANREAKRFPVVSACVWIRLFGKGSARIRLALYALHLIRDL